MGIEHYIGQARDQFLRKSLTSDEFLDFMRENTLPVNTLMAHYHCAIMEIETKFNVLNKQFSCNMTETPSKASKPV